MMVFPQRLLDADIVIDMEHGHPPALAWLQTFPPGTLLLPGYVVMELYRSAGTLARIRATDKIIQIMPVVWAGDAESSRAVSLFRTLHLSHGIGLVDMLNAATALTYSLPLCTFNVKHYHFIPDLLTEQPYAR